MIKRKTIPEILLASGNRFNYLYPEDSVIDIVDIATALSKMCRFTGHCFGHYSVAQHSVLVSHVIPARYALYGLLHDASEAYTGDINKPLKDLLGEVFGVIEDRIQRVIYNHYGLSATAPREEVHHADMVMLATEKRDLMPHDDGPWIMDDYEPLGLRTIQPMERQEAYGYFMKRFWELIP